MSEAPDDLSLAAEFPPASREQWLKLVDGVLKGAPFDRKLVARTYDGLSIAPLYSRAAGAHRAAGRTPGAPWQVSQRVEHPDPAAANAEALHDLENGATALTLAFAGSVGSRGYGLDPTETAVARALEGVHLDGIAVELDLGVHHRAACEALIAQTTRLGIAPASTNIRFGLDPIGGVATSGVSPAPLGQLSGRLADVVQDLVTQGFKGPFAVADGRIVHDAGGSEAQELAYSVAVGTAYLRALEARGIALDVARRLIFFRLAADSDQFLTIAKFRTLRKLWARIEMACGLVPEPIFISGETAWRMMTKRDPWVNMLRATIAVFCAGLGGADSISVLPYSAALGLPDRFARRMARNTQLILLEESNLAKVSDPTAGSGGIEDLTQQLSVSAWALFQDIEKPGGAESALEQGLIQRWVTITRTERQAAVSRRKDALTGTSEFPELKEVPVAVLDVAPVAVLPSEPVAVTIEPLPSIRLATPFEHLRDASDVILARTGSRPRIFLANLGSPADFNARAMFAKNFFEAGGIEAMGDKGFVDIQELAAGFKQSGAALACLCSSDAVYANQAVSAAKALGAAGARHVYLAGRPGERETALRAAGVGTFISVGSDVLAALQAAHALTAGKTG
jgi:methylmalonyl-CoA mutase